MLALKESDTLIGNLSKEVELLRIRCKSIVSSIINSHDEALLIRLKKELDSLENRRQEIIRIASNIQKGNISDNLSIEFLIELCNR